MNGVTEQRGLSARQKASKNDRDFFPRHFTLMLMALALTVSSCQTSGQGDGKSIRESASATDSLNHPKVNIKVNKRYDDKGNVVGFDSTYTSFYSNIEGDTLMMDSLMRSFDRHFDLGTTSFFGRDFLEETLTHCSLMIRFGIRIFFTTIFS